MKLSMRLLAAVALIAGAHAQPSVWLTDSLGTRLDTGSGTVMYGDGFVCDDRWDFESGQATRNAQVICRELGYPWTEATAETGVRLNRGSTFSVDDLVCEGSESSITDCSYSETHNCGRQEGVNVTCNGDMSDRTDPPTETDPPATPAPGGAGLRLSDGSSGLVMYNDGYACDDWYNDEIANAQVICRQLGFPWENATVETRQETNSTNFTLDDLDCAGDEASVEACTARYDTHNCSSSEGVRVTCVPGSGVTPPADSSGLSLSNGSSGTVMYNGGYVCDDWNNDQQANAQVICRQLGYEWEGATWSLGVSVGVDNFTMDDLDCDGTETSIEQCTMRTEENCGPTEGVEVTCGAALAGGSGTEQRGIWLTNGDSGIAMYNDGYVCDDFNNGSATANAQVICRQLGYEWTGATATLYQTLPEDNFTLDDLACEGNEASVEECSNNVTSENCGVSEGVSIQCGPAGTGNPNWELSLDDNGLVMYGDGYVCDDWYGNPTANAQVICRQLGLPWAGASAQLYQSIPILPTSGSGSYGSDSRRRLQFGSNFGSNGSSMGSFSGNDAFSMDDLNCTGSEETVEDCSFTTNHNCSQGEGVRVICAEEGEGSPSPSTRPSGEPATGSASLEGATVDESGNTTGILMLGDGYVCDDAFTRNDGVVACREMGMYYVQHSGSTNVSEDNFSIDDLECTGEEANLTECDHTTQENCWTTEGVTLWCSTEEPEVPEGLSLSADGLLMYGPGYVCDDNWSSGYDFGSDMMFGSSGMSVDEESSGDRNAAVVCRALGFDPSGARWSSSVQLPHSSFTVDDLDCTGDESDIADCTWTADHNCSSFEGVRISCDGSTNDDFNVVLGTDGLLMVDMNGQMGYVCDDYFDETAARVVCRELGLEYTTYMSVQEASEDFFLVDNVQCTGEESRLAECEYVGMESENCSANEGLRVVCEGELELNSQLGEGNLLMAAHEGGAGYVCDDGFGQNEAMVVCRELGLDTENVYYETQQRVSEDSGFLMQDDPNMFLMDDVSCSGTETALRDCDFTSTDNCSAGEGVKVFCGESGGLRYARAADGVVEAYRGDERGYVCDDSWDQNASEVLCRELGFGTDNVTFETRVQIPSSDFFADDVMCTGEESSVRECNVNTVSHNCADTEGVRVWCDGSSNTGGSGVSAEQVCEATEQCSWVQEWVGSLRQWGEDFRGMTGRVDGLTTGLTTARETADAAARLLDERVIVLEAIELPPDHTEAIGLLETQLVAANGLADRVDTLEQGPSTQDLLNMINAQRTVIEGLQEQLRITNELVTAMSNSGGSSGGGEPANPCGRELSRQETKNLGKCAANTKSKKCRKNSACEWVDDACTLNCNPPQ